jgi:hypothetical protein
MDNIIDFLREKYGNYWGQRFSTVEDFKKWLSDSSKYFVEQVWQIEEYPNITLVQIIDEHNTMWSEIVIIEGIHTNEEFK